jgi:hypothetical protein
MTPKINLTTVPYAFRANVTDNFNSNKNLTLADKITFRLGEIIDNVADGFISITGGLKVTENADFSKNLTVDTNTLVVDSNNNRVGIGTATPAVPLDISGSSLSALGVLSVTNTNAGTREVMVLKRASGTGGASLILDDTAGTNGRKYELFTTDDGNSEGAGKLVILRSGVAAMTIDDSGNIGISTKTPQQTLNVVGTANITTSLKVSANSNLLDANGLEINSGYLIIDPAQKFYLDNGADTYITEASANNLSIVAGGTPTMNIITGKVGIGIANPSNQLDVRRSDDNDGEAITFGSQSYYMGRLGEDPSTNKVFLANTYNSDSSYIDFRLKGSASANSKMILQGNGNVGIGTTSPSDTLDVRMPAGVNVVGLTVSSPTNAGAGSQPALNFKRYSSSVLNTTAYIASGACSQNAPNCGDIFFATGTDNSPTVNMIISPAGNVGIGTSTPSAKLDVETSSGGAAILGSSLNAATGNYAVAMGYNANASGSYSTAMGYNTQASEAAAVAIGNDAFASGQGSLAIGWTTRASGTTSLAQGNRAEALESGSVAIGDSLNATAANSYVFGKGISWSNRLTNNLTNSFMVGFGSALPTLFVNGSSVGIGTTTPLSKLHVSGAAGASGNPNGLSGENAFYAAAGTGGGGQMSNGGNGGSINISGGAFGAGSTGGAGGAVSISGGAGGSSAGAGGIGGSITLTPGAGGGNAAAGQLKVTGDANITGQIYEGTFSLNISASRAHPTNKQSISQGVNTKVTLDVEDFDANSEFASSRFTPKTKGYYQISASGLYPSNCVANQLYYIWINKTGTSYDDNLYYCDAANHNANPTITDVVYLTTTDWIELWTYHSGTNPTQLNNGGTDVYLAVAKVI